MKNLKATLASLASLPFAAFAQAQATTETVNGNLAVTQDVFVAQGVHIGQNTVNATLLPGLTLQTETDAGNAVVVNQIAYGLLSSWDWSHHNGASGRRVMTLEDDGRLLLFAPGNASTPAIVLDAAHADGARITIGGQLVLTRQNFSTLLTSGDAAENLVLGANAMGAGTNVVALGTLANAYGSSSVALGHSASAVDGNAVAIGNAAYAQGQNSITLGANASASSGEAIAIGSNAHAYHGAHALGTNASASHYSLALGYYAYAYGYDSMGVGNYATASGNASTALGGGASASGSYSIAVGYSASASAEDSIAIGNYASVPSDYYYHPGSIAIGPYSQAASSNSVAIGKYSSASSESIAMGYYASANSSLASVFGAYSSAGYHSTVLGAYATAGSSASVAIGIEAQASDNCTIAIGDRAAAFSHASIAIGYKIQTDYYTPRQIVIGSGNAIAPNAAFVIGNGTGEGSYNPSTGNYEDGRSNVFVIMNDGKGIFRHKNYVEPDYYNPNPSQGEALLVEGAATIKGKTTLNGNLELHNAQNSGDAPAITLDTSEASNPKILFNGQVMISAQDGAWGSGNGGGNMIWAGDSGSGQLAIGEQVFSNNTNAIAIGSSTTASGYASTVLGADASAYSDGSVAIGSNAYSSGWNALAIGKGTQACSAGQVVLGSYNEDVSGAAFVIGNGTNSSYGYNMEYTPDGRSNLFVIMDDGKGVFRHRDFTEPDYYNQTPAQGEALLVEGATTIKGQASLHGNMNVYNAYNATSPAITFDVSDSFNPKILFNGQVVLSAQGGTGGPGGYSSGGSSTEYYLDFYGYISGTATGEYSSANFSDASAFGFASHALADRATALGASASAENYATAVGYYSKANGIGSVTLGSYSWAKESNSIAIGTNARAHGHSSVTVGHYSRANSEKAIAIGADVETDYNTPRQIVIGSYNEPDPDATFVIADGTRAYDYYDPYTDNYEGRSNLFVIKKDGKGIFRHKDHVEADGYNPNPPTGGEALRVKGSASVEGALRVRPVGDIPMGDFSTGERP